MNNDSGEEKIINYNVALCAQDSVSLEKKQRRLNRDIPSEDVNNLSQSHNEISGIDHEEQLTKKSILYKAQQAMTKKSRHRKHGPWGCQRWMVISLQRKQMS